MVAHVRPFAFDRGVPLVSPTTAVRKYLRRAKAPAAAVHGNHNVRLLQGAQELFPALVQAMDKAVSDIQLETYIFDFTGAGAEVAQALLRAAERGVRTHLVVDGVGTGPLPKAWAERFTQAGVQFKVYSPLGPLGLLLPHRWRRLHRKLCVVDGRVLFCGGINILDDLHDPIYGTLDAPRFDFSVQATGTLVGTACTAMEQLWWRMQALGRMRQHQLPQALQALRAARASRMAAHPAPGHGGMSAALLLRDNVRNRSRIEKAYLRAIGLARQEIIIANAYFLPGGKLRRALILAARRGVTVRLLLQGKYEYFMQYHASRPIYSALLAAGVEIYEYEPSFLHAKVAVVDALGEQPWATVGSSNLDPLSLLLAREANVVVEDASFATDLRQRLMHAMRHSGRRILPGAETHRHWHQRVLDRVAYAMMRTALWLTGKRY
jgi:cardiolipin synthase